jgi:hypothetical protein
MRLIWGWSDHGQESGDLQVFLKLDSLGVDNVVTFYDRLQEVDMNYTLPLMPFKGV